ncbi:hypothetical protein JCM19240_5474 [Vibrio maritimus]|uniref:Uncharacterized protein n=1 Tax=Vibrio maritimus TaxID=990268 RepID=A0A090SYQ5_9VIBR|nr:hypothetical protein JCM19240_5474 [Vibrio maritimus]
MDVELDGDWKTYWRSPVKGVLRLNLTGAGQPTSKKSIGTGRYLRTMSSWACSL